MAQLTPQERQQAFLQNYNQLIDRLVQQYGFTIAPCIQQEEFMSPQGQVIQSRAALKLQEVQGWQPPPEPEIKTQVEQATEAIPETEAAAPLNNGKHKTR